MKAVILNSGTGSRMGALTADRPKGLVPLTADGQTILDRQLGFVEAAGIRDVVITTGFMAEAVEAHLRKRADGGLRIKTVYNPRFAETNYIESFRLAEEELRGDVVSMHGDLVFSADVWQALMAAPMDVLVTTPNVPLPEKDFKARLTPEGVVREVSIHAFGGDCVACQPLYKLSGAVWRRWQDEMAAFCAAGNDKVYAENALNEISSELNIRALPALTGFCMEVDNPADWEVAKQAVQKEKQS